MNRDDANRITAWIGELFPEITPAKAIEIRDSIEPLPTDHTEDAVRELHAAAKWFDLPRLLKAVRKRAPQSCGGPTADQIREAEAAAARQRLAQHQAEREQAMASFEDVLALPDAELERLKAIVLEDVDGMLRTQLERRPPRESPTLLAWIQSHLRRQRAGNTRAAKPAAPKPAVA